MLFGHAHKFAIEVRNESEDPSGGMGYFQVWMNGVATCYDSVETIGTLIGNSNIDIERMLVEGNFTPTETVKSLRNNLGELLDYFENLSSIECDDDILDYTLLHWVGTCDICYFVDCKEKPMLCCRSYTCVERDSSQDLAVDISRMDLLCLMRSAKQHLLQVYDTHQRLMKLGKYYDGRFG